MTGRDWILLLIGGAAGCYASFIAGQVVVWLKLKHDFFYRIELLSAIINQNSIEQRQGQYPLWRILEAKAIEFYFHGHDKAYRECHAIANEMQEVFSQIRTLADPHYYEISSRKTEWMRRVASLNPSWRAFFSPKRNMNSVLDFYLDKESEYLRLFKSNIASRGGSVSQLPNHRSQ